jgi:hypothetical protein
MARIDQKQLVSQLAALLASANVTAPTVAATAAPLASASAPVVKEPRPKTVEVRERQPKPGQTWTPFKVAVIHNGANGRAYRETSIDGRCARAFLAFLGISEQQADALLKSKGL